MLLYTMKCQYFSFLLLAKRFAMNVFAREELSIKVLLCFALICIPIPLLGNVLGNTLNRAMHFTKIVSKMNVFTGQNTHFLVISCPDVP